jgi:regulator of sigma E protease
MSILLLIVGLLLFVGLVVVHEYGHFIAARRGGVEVEEFGIGFPPRAWAKRLKSGLLFTLNWLPLGGFVRLKGEHDSARAPGSFGAASFKTKVTVMLAGVFMNLVTAFALLTLLALIGMPKLFPDQFTVPSDTHVVKNAVLAGYIEPESPASAAGLRTADRLLYVQPAGCQDCAQVRTDIKSVESLRPATEGLAGQSVTIGYVRDGQPAETVVQLRGAAEIEESLDTDDPKGYLGVAPTEYTLQRSTWSAPIVALGIIKQFTQLTLQGIGTALSGLFTGDTAKASEQVAGPLGIFAILKEGSLLGYQFILMIIAVISLTLAIMNVLPIPALDGGRLFVMLLFRAIRKPLTKSTEEWIHGTGFALLMVLFVLITIVDVKRIF